jgi:hypothetical protein
MKRAIAALMAALLAAPGCAVRLPVRTTGSMAYAKRIAVRQQPQAPRPSDAAAWERYLKSLPVGSKVKVATLDGRSFKATYMGVEGEVVTVRPRTRIPEPPVSIPIGSLASLELDQELSTGKIIAIAAGVAGATVLGIFLILAATLD